MHTASTDASHVSVSLNEIEGSVQQLTTSTHDVRSALSLVSFSQQSLSADVSVHIRRHRELAEAVSAVREASTAHSAALPLPDALEPLAEDFTRRQKDLVTRTAALKSSLDPTAFDAPPPALIDRALAAQHSALLSLTGEAAHQHARLAAKEHF
jgi:hypothetical protein